jgi:hypothetical protein
MPESPVRPSPSRPKPNLTPKMPAPKLSRETSRRSNNSLSTKKTDFDSISIMFVFILLGMVLVWENHDLRLGASVIVSASMTWSITKALFSSIYIYFENSIQKALTKMKNFFESRRKKSHLLLSLWTYFDSGNASVAKILLRGSSAISSLFIIISFLLLLAAFLMFTAVQVYYEAQHVVVLLSEVSKKLASKYPEIKNYMSDLDVGQVIDDAFQKCQDFVLNFVYKKMAGSNDRATIEQTQGQIKVFLNTNF